MPEQYTAVEQFVEGLVASDRAAAAGLAIAIDGQPVFQYLTGEARPGVPATPATLWPVASISKLYTASAVMSLVEDGALALRTRVCDVFPDFQGDGRDKITLRQLLTHTSGVPYEPADLSELSAAGASLEELVAHAWTDPLLFEPGTGQTYSDTGLALAGLMAAKVTGLSFPDLIRTRVLEPAGLSETFMPPPLELLDTVATVRGSLGEGTPWAHYNTPYGLGTAHPSWGTVASLPDLLRFILHFDPSSPRRLHSEAALAAMTRDQTGGLLLGETAPLPDRVIPPWGAGFMLRGRFDTPGIASPESYGHMGATGCVAWVDPRWRVSLAFVSNSHIRRGYDEVLSRLESAINVALSAATRSA